MTSSRAPLAVSEAEQSRLAAVDLAVALGEAGVPSLLASLTEPSWVVRRSVVAGLSALGAAAIPGLVDVLLHQRDDEARIAAAVDALSDSTGPASGAALELAAAEDPAIVCDAAQILGRRRDAEAVPVLEGLVLDADDNVAVAAIEALGRIGGSRALGSLSIAAQSGRFFRVFPAMDALGRTGDPRAVAPLAALLDDPLYSVEAARALARTGESSAVVPLSRLLSRPGTANVRTFASAFYELHEQATERHGTVRRIVGAFAPIAANPAIARRVRGSLIDADVSEQVALCTVLGAMGDQESIALLTSLVQSPAPVGPAASKALERIGDRADMQIERMLREGDSASRLAALPLARRDSSSAAVAACLEDPEAAVRALACDALGRLGDTAPLAALFQCLEDADAAVVQAATSALQSLGGKETEKRALALSESGNPVVRRAALRILSYFGYPSAFDVFVRCAADPSVRDVAIQGLGLVEHEGAAQVLVELARDAAPRSRALAMKALGHRTTEAGALTELLAGLHDPDAWVRYYACQALGRSRATEASAPVAKLLADEAGQVRVAAIEALASLGGDLAYRLLSEAAESDDVEVCRAALIGLGIARHASGLPTITKAARSEDPTKRLIAAAALSNFDHPSVLPLLLSAAADDVETVRTSAVGFIASRSGAETASALIGLLQLPEPPGWVVPALATPIAGRVSAILSALETADEAVAGHLVSALARMGTPEASSALVTVMSRRAVPARKVAATALGALRTKDAVDTLRRVAVNDPDADVRRIASLLLPG